MDRNTLLLSAGESLILNSSLTWNMNVLNYQPCLNYMFVQNKLLSFTKVEPVVKQTDCVHESFIFILEIFICIEKAVFL